MDSVYDYIEQLMRPRQRDHFGREIEARATLIGRLFMTYREKDADLEEHYAMATADIPLFFLASAVLLLERTRVYPSLPQTGELWNLARDVAGMNRQQYHAGRYLKPPRDWPPAGKRHAVTVREFEKLPGDPAKMLTGGSSLIQLAEEACS